ncbi:MAG: 16S rRNA (guanine(527)-N(7))-methyltransferase RsmG [Christensenellaceae bacterium]|jgi:16S rRNA (guanine527-N7)-methyltransferase|nr:16S rRNA (guanine(527)-N(7))-methyltransferase RsmG [Christensenellaceae bacterium]
MDKTLRDFNEFLVEYNKNVNLTAHKTIEDSALFNIEDSLLFVGFMREILLDNVSCVDIGSGCGCPAIPLAVSFPKTKWTMVDSIGKKVDFLNAAVEKCKITNARAIKSRIEDLAKDNEKKFDVLTARAVANLPTLLEYALPLLKVGGVALLYKGVSAEEEINQSKRALSVLGGEVIRVLKANLTPEIERTLIVVKKVKPTPSGYPRGGNKPRLSPL